MSSTQIATPSKATPSKATPAHSPTAVPKDKRPGFGKSQGMVTINVSLEPFKDTFIVHKNFICFYSPFFDAAFNGAFKEGETQVLDLEGVLPAAFNLFVNWLYTQLIEAPGGEDIPESDLVELWIIGSRCSVPKIQNQSLELLEKARTDRHRIPLNYTRVYEGTEEGSPLRRYTVAIAATVPRETSKPEDYPHDMLIDIVKYLMEERSHFRATPLEFSKDEWKEFYVDEQVAYKPALRAVGSTPNQPLLPIDSPKVTENSTTHLKDSPKPIRISLKRAKPATNPD